MRPPGTDQPRFDLTGRRYAAEVKVQPAPWVLASGGHLTAVDAGLAAADYVANHLATGQYDPPGFEQGFTARLMVHEDGERRRATQFEDAGLVWALVERGAGEVEPVEGVRPETPDQEESYFDD